MTQLNSSALSNSVRDVSEIFDQIIAKTPLFISLLSTGGKPATHNKHEWVEDTLTPRSWTVNGDSVAAATITFDSVTGMRVGDVLRFETVTTLASNTAQVLVTDITGLVVTGTRPFGGTTDATITDNSTAYLISRRGRDDDATSDATKEASVDYNYTQIFDYTVQVGLTAQNTNTYDGANSISYQEETAMRRLAYELNNAALFGRRTAASGADGGTMAGLQFYIDGNTTAVAGALTLASINAIVKDIMSDGGGTGNMAIIAHPTQAQKISAFAAVGLSVARNDSTVGQSITRIQSDLAPILTLVTDFNMPQDEVYVGELNSSRIVTLQNDGMRSEDATQPGARYIARRIHGQQTLEVKNGGELWGKLTGLTV